MQIIGLIRIDAMDDNGAPLIFKFSALFNVARDSNFKQAPFRDDKVAPTLNLEASNAHVLRYANEERGLNLNGSVVPGLNHNVPAVGRRHIFFWRAETEGGLFFWGCGSVQTPKP